MARFRMWNGCVQRRRAKNLLAFTDPEVLEVGDVACSTGADESDAGAGVGGESPTGTARPVDAVMRGI